MLSMVLLPPGYIK